jgi:hypothetical protein
LDCFYYWPAKKIKESTPHKCSKGKQKQLANVSEVEKVNAYSPTEALSLLIIDAYSLFSLSNSRYLPKLLKSVKAQDIPAFYDGKITDCIKNMGWQKFELNAKYCGEVGTHAVTIDAVDIAGKH